MKKKVKSLVTGALSEVVVTRSRSKSFGATSVRIFAFSAKYSVLFYFLVKVFTAIPLVQGSLGCELVFSNTSGNTYHSDFDTIFMTGENITL